MTTFSDTRQLLQHKIDNLSDYQLQEVLQFVNNLSSEIPESSSEDIYDVNNEVDSLSKFIGKVYHGSLAQSIDQELYG